jgi:CDP-glucose 4,6-dehydratase
MATESTSSQFWKNKKVFITGHTGFKGSWLCYWLKNMGADICGYALAPETRPNIFDALELNQSLKSNIADIRDLKKLSETVLAFQPEIVLHLAAQPLVRRSYKLPLETYEINVMGTANLLEACRNIDSIRSIVIVTTDKCYENKEWPWGYREIDPMGGHDPYSSSKGCAELVTAAYRKSFYSDNKNVGIASARAGNVIGGGDWSEDRLIPDMIKAFQKNETVTIRSPQAIRPWQHVLEPLSGYLRLAEELYNNPKTFSEAFNFGPNDNDCITVGSLVTNTALYWGPTTKVKIEPNSQNLHEATFLKLDISKAKQKLSWAPKWSIEEALKITVEWYKCFYENKDLLKLKELTLRQIENYQK